MQNKDNWLYAAPDYWVAGGIVWRAHLTWDRDEDLHPVPGSSPSPYPFWVMEPGDEFFVEFTDPVEIAQLKDLYRVNKVSRAVHRANKRMERVVAGEARRGDGALKILKDAPRQWAAKIKRDKAPYGVTVRRVV